MKMKVIFPVIILIALLAACSLAEGLPIPGIGGQTQPAPSATAVESTPLPSTPPTAGPTGTPQATPVPALTLWVPPEFDPSADTPAGRLLLARLEAFTAESGAQVQVRVKAASGPGGLIESLSTASTAAPLALPSVVALPRADIETAALKGLILPLDGLTGIIDEPDWYDYARGLALVQGATFALPFAGDTTVVVYRPARVLSPPARMEDVLSLGQPMGFPAGDPQALFVLALYQSIGGQVEDAQRRPMLQPETLSQVLSLLADGEQRGVFPYWLGQYETSAQVWQAFKDGRVHVVAGWLSTYLNSLPEDAAVLPMPTLDDTPAALATGWGWTVAEPDPNRQALAVQLAEFLSQGSFLALWSEAAGYLPTRPSALAGWENQAMKTLLSPMAVSAQVRPSVEQLTSLGPVLKEATLKVLKRESDAAQAAQSAAEKLTVP